MQDKARRMWEAVRNIGSGLSLVAFAIAMIGIVYRARMKTQASIIKNATGERQVKALAITAAYFGVDTDGLTPEQKQHIVITQVDARTKRDAALIKAALIVAGLLALIAIVSILFEQEPRHKPDVAALRSELAENKVEIEDLSGRISRSASAAGDMRQGLERQAAVISRQQLRLDRGEGTSEARADAARAIQEANQVDARARSVLSRYETEKAEWVSERARLDRIFAILEVSYCALGNSGLAR